MKHKGNKKVLRRILSLNLVMAMLVTGLNLDTMSQSIYAANKNGGGNENAEEKVTVVRELVSERTENSNTYLMSDGSKRLEIYNGNIRYLQNEKMVDYDSSLTEISKRDRTRLKKIADDTESKQINKYEYVNTQGDTKQYFAESLNDETPIILTKDNYSIRFVPSVDSSSNKTDDNNEQNVKFSGIDNNENKISYENQNKKIDYEYYSLNNGVKEEIVLHEKPSTNIFEFKYELKNLKLVKDKKVNIIDIVDEKTSEEVAYIYSPNIIEQDGIPSYDNIEYNVIANNDGSYSLRIEVNRKYLEQASYPITIDPTLVWRDSSEVLLRETFKCGGATTSVIDSSKTFMISTLNGGYESQVYIKFPNLNDKIRGKKIDFGYVNITPSNISGKPDINVYQVMEDWDYNKVTWATKPSIGEEKLGKSNGDYATDTMFTVWMTNWLRKIASGEINDNFGIALYNDNKEPTNFVTSYGFSAEDISKRPLFIIQYIDPIDSGAVYDGSFQINSEYDDNDNTIKLQWDDTIEDIDRYEVYKRVGNSDKFEIIGATIDTNYSLALDGTEETMDIRVMAIKDGRTIEVATDDTNYLSNIVSIVKTGGADEGTNETAIQYEQTTFDTDGDGLKDGYEIWDFKTLWNMETGVDEEGNKTYDLDTDKDGFPDSYEVFTLGTDPVVANETGTDSDGDGWTDLKEYQEGTDPWLKDSDFDGTNDRGDSTPRKTNDYTRQTRAAEATVHVGLYDRQYSETIDGVTYTYITNIYCGDIKQISADYGETSLNKILKYFYDEKGNNTAIVEAYDETYDPSHTQTICITYTYDNDDNVIFICDQRTKYTMDYGTDGQMTQLKVGKQTLMTYADTKVINNEDSDGDTSNVAIGGIIDQDEKIETYENGQSIRTVITTYKVDNGDKTSTASKTETYYNSNENSTYITYFNSDGEIMKLEDYSANSENPVEWNYSYTENGTLITRNDGFTKSVQTSENEENGASTTITSYGFKDLKDNNRIYTSTITSQTETETDAEGVERTKDVTSQTLHNSDIVSIEMMDDFSEEKIRSNTHNINVIKSTYEKNKNTHATYNVDIYANDSDKKFDYTYDLTGNITKIELNGDVKYEYDYDAHGRLTTEKDYTILKEYSYDYNTNGNVYGKTEYIINENGNRTDSSGTTVYYDYGNSEWPDQLTEYNGQVITYDNSGNPLTYVDGLAFTWNRGRQLSTVTLGDNSSVSYRYNENGFRTYKHTDDETTVYEWDGSTLLRETIKYKATNQKVDVWYLYDANERVIGFEYNYLNFTGTLVTARVYYEKNLQGDVIGLLDTRGAEIATYAYDAWGNVTDTTYVEGKEIPYELNHITYRGYYRDDETGFYYLQSRYYDSEVGRFINADDVDYIGASGKIYNNNLYSYCESNPLSFYDPSGSILISTCVLIGIGVGAVIGATVGSIYGYKTAKKLNIAKKNQWKFVVGYGIGGALIGGVIGGFMGYGVGVTIGATYSSGVAVSAVNSSISNISSNTWYHILQKKHAWKLVTKNVSRTGLKKIIQVTLKKGVTTLINKTVSKGVTSMIYETAYVYSGKTVVVRYAVVNGIIKIADAWIKTR